MAENNKQRRETTFGQAIIIFAVSIGILMVGIIGLGLDPQIPLLAASIVCVLYATYLRIEWSEIEKKSTEMIGQSIQAMIIIMLIGMLVGTWMSSGTVPYIIYVGLKTLSPKWFLLTTFIICSIMSVATGSSWTTAGTIGVALMGVGYGLNIPAGITAGAIICGAYFGDKLSPLSDTSNFAAAVSNTNIYDLVGSMLWTTGPAALVTGIIFTIIGLRFDASSANASEITLMLETLDATFTLNPIVLIPLIVLLILVIKKFPAIPGMVIGILLGVLVAVLVQGETLGDALSYLQSGFIGRTGLAQIDALLTRGGLMSMLFTISLMFVSLFLATLLEVTGVTTAILSKLDWAIKSMVGLVTTTIISGIVLNFFAADPYLATLLPGRTFAPAYDKRNLDRKVLGRTIQDGGIVYAPLVPWGSNGIYMQAVLGVSVFAYAPYYFMYLTPVFSILLAITGKGIWYNNPKNINEKVDEEVKVDEMGTSIN